VAGFLRDDGTAVCKRMEWKTDELALYKVVLLNLGLARKLGAEYQPDLKMYEDICLNHEVLRAGGHTLKCQSFCFRASHVKAGGCSEQRVHRVGTRMEDLMAPEALTKLPQARQEAVSNLLKWAQSKEEKFGHEGEPPGASNQSILESPRPMLKRKTTEAFQDAAEYRQQKARSLDVQIVKANSIN